MPRVSETSREHPAQRAREPRARARRAPADGAGSCRSCPAWCDRVVFPSGCFEGECPRLAVDAHEGRARFRCLEGVFEVTVDLERFTQAQRTRGGFGALRVMREPLPMCRCDIDIAHADRAEGPCVDPDFLLTALRRPYEVAEHREVGEPRSR